MEFERESLYRDVWAQPITTLAKRFGLSDNGLRKVCIALEIPLPGRGHWAKVAAGHSLPTPPLPPATGPTHFASRLAATDTPTRAYPDDQLQQRIALEARSENVIEVTPELMEPHPLVKAAAAAVRAHIAGLQENRNKLERPGKRSWPPEPTWAALERPNWREYLERGVMENDPTVLPMRVAIESIDRALRLWDALLKGCKARGLRISVQDRRVRVADGLDWIALRLSEQVDQAKRAVRVGESTVHARRPTGSLRMFVNETRIEDKPGYPLEQQLNDIMVRIYRSIASQRAGRALAAQRRMDEEAAAQVRERERAAAEEAARLREEELQRLQAEQAAIAERERLLVAEAGAWRDAVAIREYAAHVGSAAADEGVLTPALKDWLAWADSTAERLDPTRERLGQQQMPPPRK